MSTFTSLANEWLQTHPPATAQRPVSSAGTPVPGLGRDDAGGPKPSAVAAVARPFLVQDPVYWEDDFSRWALGHCLFRDGCWWSATALHLRFCEWCIVEGTVGCMLPTFAALLGSEGFTLGSVLTAGMVYGLVPKAAYLALTTPARRAKAAPVWRGAGR